MKLSKYALFLLVLLTACSPKTFKTSWLNQKAPDHFKARFETTKGNFEIEAYRQWSPAGVDRLYQIIKHKYYNNTPIYRVIDNYVSQFGNVDSLSSTQWQGIDDEPVIKKNTAGTISFARAGQKTRDAHIFINIKDNNKLDTLKYAGVTGFPVVATITKGADLKSIFHSYGDKPMEIPDSTKNPMAYFKIHFPEMDYIRKAYIIK